ncbi:MAG TPA: hemerythrin domain-containing protein [Acidimicrobiales bacterium]|nr:hemerythrin domain-containing protein [Acidimicrobiales bacterium]
MDAIALLKADHREIERLFTTVERAGSGARKAKANAVSRMVRALTVHGGIEEEVFYPAVLEALPDARRYVLESLEEHNLVTWLCLELEGLDSADERYDAKAGVLMATTRYHMGEEEAMLFPEVRHALGRRGLAEVGERLASARRRASTRPRPDLSATPAVPVIAGMVAGAVDRVRDAGRRAVEDARHAAS